MWRKTIVALVLTLFVIVLSISIVPGLNAAGDADLSDVGGGRTPLQNMNH